MGTQLNGKVVVITGGGSGIGAATAQLFSSEGAQVVSLDIDTARANEALDSLKGKHSKLTVDVSNAQQAESTINDILSTFGRIDALVNVAGGRGRNAGDGPTDVCTLEAWQTTLTLNLNSRCYICTYTLKAMLNQGRGAIVNVSSVLGLVGGDDAFATHAYATSKGAVISLTRSIASYYAPHGIRANVICPGLIETPMSKRAQESEQIRARLSQLQPLTSDFGSPEDVAHAALYLASDASSFVTGAVLTVDGGWTVR